MPRVAVSSWLLDALRPLTGNECTDCSTLASAALTA
jgi:hypothetical protein